jgi:hypothetical protein
MNENLDKKKEQAFPEQNQAPVDEKGGFAFSSAVKISDPNTKEIIVQIRGDY